MRLSFSHEGFPLAVLGKQFSYSTTVKWYECVVPQSDRLPCEGHAYTVNLGGASHQFRIEIELASWALGPGIGQERRAATKVLGSLLLLSRPKVVEDESLAGVGSTGKFDLEKSPAPWGE